MIKFRKEYAIIIHQTQGCNTYIFHFILSQSAELRKCLKLVKISKTAIFRDFSNFQKTCVFYPYSITQIPNFEVLRSKTAVLEPKTYFSGFFTISSDQQFWEILAIWIKTLSSFCIRFTSIMAQNDQKGGTRITFSVNFRFYSTFHAQ